MRLAMGRLIETSSRLSPIPEASNFVYVAVELERYARVVRGLVKVYIGGTREQRRGQGQLAHDMNNAEQPQGESGVFDAAIFEPFIYNAQFPFIFCRLCKGGYLVTSIRIHMAQLHAEHMSMEERRRICDIAERLPNMARCEEDLRRRFRPQTMRKALPYLRKAEYNGLKCKMCGYICRLRISIRQHMRKYHAEAWAWHQSFESYDAAGQRELDLALWRDGVKFQQIFRKPRLMCLVEICDDEVIWGRGRSD